MSKKTPIKKTKRRLKRTVRRSLAAVLMITAIGVAAIPVPENYAEGEGVSAPAIQYVDADPNNYEADDNTKNKYAESSPKYIDSVTKEFDRAAYEKAIADAYKNGKNDENYTEKDVLYPTEIIIKEGTSTYLTWQFLYEPLSAKTGKLCKYNDTFRVERVDLGLQPISHYYAITSADYNNYFTNPANVSQELKDAMDNLNNSSNQVYPTDTIEYSYDTFDKVTYGINSSNPGVKSFLKNYYGEEYETYTKKFIEYYEGNEQGTKPDGVLKVSPSMLENSDKMRFFCEHNLVLSGTGYTLSPVLDYRFEGDGSTVYVATGGNPENLSSGMGDLIYEDYEGYIVTKDRHAINIIGDEAFKNVKNVGQIDVSGQVKYIGDSAFEGAGISRLYIGNAEKIGNKAFYGCSTLKEVTFDENSGIEEIGYEAFRSSGICNKISLPYSIKKICHGAFSDCGDLSEIEFDNNNSYDKLELEDYVFYNDKNLTMVDFGKIGVESMGIGCFAIQTPSGDLLKEFSFPARRLANLGEYVLANRRSLQVVNIPYYQGTIPETTFYNCFGLERVQFYEDSAMAVFGSEDGGDSKLFYDVTNTEFCVYGPEFYNGKDPAYPRVGTWDAIRKDGKGIPYVYESNGKTYYEVAYESEDDTKYRYAAGNDGELISCALITQNPGNVDIIIPSKIGKYDIKSIGENCFSDDNLRKHIKSITIQNKSVNTIADGAFKDLPKLSKVKIGDSVTYIGANAFSGCKALEDVYFTKPSAGYEALKFGENAFVTTGSQLTFHGDIVKGYAPFDWATEKYINGKKDENGTYNVLKDADDKNSPELNICYQSLWDSEVGTHLTVMIDKTNDEVTLLDYPKYDDLSATSIENDEELQDYCRDMENYYYYTVYDAGNDVERLRKEYALIWNAKQNNWGSVDIGEKTINSADYVSELDKRYGPWINPNYCGDSTEAGYWITYLGTSATTETAKTSLMDVLFEPIVVQAAAGNPIPYFKQNPYNFMENYNNYLNNPNDYDSLPDYKRVPDKVWNFINATQHIVVPDGVDSIDVYGYYNSNYDNYNTYIKSKVSSKSNKMYTSNQGNANVIPGLFSGNYGDDTDNPGNDYVKSIVLTSVKSIPDYAFDNCDNLEKVELGTVEQVGELPFRDCVNLVDLSGSEEYPAENGILYERLDGENEEYKIVECLLARGGDTLPITDKTVSQASDPKIQFVKEIAKYAFSNCDNISLIDLSGAMTLNEIPENCFDDCDILSQVRLSASVNDIQDNAFANVRKNTTDTPRLTVEIPGREVSISDKAFGDLKRGVLIKTYDNTAAYRYAKYYEKDGMKYELYSSDEDTFSVDFIDYDGTKIGTTQYVKNGKATIPTDLDELRTAGHRPGYIFTEEWLGTNGQSIDEKITQNCSFIAQYKPDGSTVDGKYYVKFMDGIDGSNYSTGEAEKLGNEWVYYVTPQSSFKNAGYTVPTEKSHQGYEFLGWYANGSTWSDTASVTASTTVFALYKPSTTSGSSTNTSNGTTTLSNSTTTTSGATTSTSSSSSNTSSSTSSSSSNTSSSSNSSNTSGSGSTTGTYTVMVENGSGSGSYTAGSTVIITANTPAEGMVFQKWTTESNGVNLASVSLPATTFVMPANNVTVTANYVAGNGATAATTGTGNGGSTTGNNGNTVVDITKPGISNKDLATANVNGSTDNFVIKISETDEATRAVAAALTNKYGSLDNILYYAMDITLYDSTGTTKITDTSGLSIDITIPIPDALVAYGGNNMAGAVINGDQLEELNESFTTINGVPCVRFTATHFSPYTIYVDTGNLTEGMLDVTPKTGDPIHPKWFLSIGLACLSIILFLKKDKNAKVKTA